MQAATTVNWPRCARSFGSLAWWPSGWVVPISSAEVNRMTVRTAVPNVTMASAITMGVFSPSVLIDVGLRAHCKASHGAAADPDEIASGGLGGSADPCGTFWRRETGFTRGWIPVGSPWPADPRRALADDPHGQDDARLGWAAAIDKGQERKVREHAWGEAQPAVDQLVALRPSVLRFRRLPSTWICVASRPNGIGRG